MCVMCGCEGVNVMCGCVGVIVSVEMCGCGYEGCEMDAVKVHV